MNAPVEHASPRCSWWVGLDREALHAAADRERVRMAWTRFGRIKSTGLTASDDPKLRERCRRREEAEA